MLQITPLILQKVETRKILKQVMVKVQRMMHQITLKILQKVEMKEKKVLMILKSLMLEKMMRLISYRKMYLLI